MRCDWHSGAPWIALYVAMLATLFGCESGRLDRLRTALLAEVSPGTTSAGASEVMSEAWGVYRHMVGRRYVAEYEGIRYLVTFDWDSAHQAVVEVWDNPSSDFYFEGCVVVLKDASKLRRRCSEDFWRGESFTNDKLKYPYAELYTDGPRRLFRIFALEKNVGLIGFNTSGLGNQNELYALSNIVLKPIDDQAVAAWLAEGKADREKAAEHYERYLQQAAADKEGRADQARAALYETLTQRADEQAARTAATEATLNATIAAAQAQADDEQRRASVQQDAQGQAQQQWAPASLPANLGASAGAQPTSGSSRSLASWKAAGGGTGSDAPSAPAALTMPPSGNVSQVGLPAKANGNRSPGQGQLSAGPQTIGRCQATWVGVNYNLSTLVGEPMVLAQLRWDGAPGCRYPSGTKVWLKVQAGTAYAWVEGYSLNGAEPHAEFHGSQVSYTWSQTLCGHRSNAKVGCLSEELARALWTNGSVTDFVIAWPPAGEN